MYAPGCIVHGYSVHSAGRTTENTKSPDAILPLKVSYRNFRGHNCALRSWYETIYGYWIHCFYKNIFYS